MYLGIDLGTSGVKLLLLNGAQTLVATADAAVPQHRPQPTWSEQHPADWMAAVEAAVAQLGLPVHRMASGAGHDAMQMHNVMPQAMLFVRGQNSGISHNPLESTTSADMQLAIDAFTRFTEDLASDFAKDL